MAKTIFLHHEVQIWMLRKEIIKKDILIKSFFGPQKRINERMDLQSWAGCSASLVENRTFPYMSLQCLQSLTDYTPDVVKVDRYSGTIFSESLPIRLRSTLDNLKWTTLVTHN